MRAADEAVVKGVEQGDGPGAVSGLSADGADKDGDDHGGGESFAADVAHDHEHAAHRIGDLLEEVAADLVRRLIKALHMEAGALVELIGQQDELDLTGGFEFALEALLALAGDGKAADEEDQQGQQEE